MLSALMNVLVIWGLLFGLTNGLDSTLLAIRDGNNRLEDMNEHLSGLLRQAKIGNVLLRRIIQVHAVHVIIQWTPLLWTGKNSGSEETTKADISMKERFSEKLNSSTVDAA